MKDYESIEEAIWDIDDKSFPVFFELAVDKLNNLLDTYPVNIVRAKTLFNIAQTCKGRVLYDMEAEVYSDTLYLHMLALTADYSTTLENLIVVLTSNQGK